MRNQKPNPTNENVLFALRRANPVTDDTLTPEQQQRADATLASILTREDMGSTATDGGSSRRLTLSLVAAAAVVALVVGVSVVPRMHGTNEPPVLTAADYLSTAADASASMEQPAVTSTDYLRRVDQKGDSRVISTFVTDASGEVTSHVEHQGPPLPWLYDADKVVLDSREVNGAGDVDTFIQQRFGTSADDRARGALTVLLTPGLQSDTQKQAYSVLAGLPGNRVVSVASAKAGGDDEVVTIARGDGENAMEFSVIPETGQLTRVVGLNGVGVATTVDAAGIVGCVHVTGLAGPEQLSLACADNNYLLDALTWQGWNSPEATATGTAWINGCDPSCTEGTRKQFRVHVIASARKSCGYNLDVYTRVRVTFRDEDKAQSELAQDETFELGCQ